MFCTYAANTGDFYSILISLLKWWNNFDNTFTPFIFVSSNNVLVPPFVPDLFAVLL